MFLFPLLGIFQANEGLVESLKLLSTLEMIILGSVGIIFVILSNLEVKDGPTLETRRFFARAGMFSWALIPVIGLLGNWINLIAAVCVALLTVFLICKAFVIGLGR